jgi:spermidine synthase
MTGFRYESQDSEGLSIGFPISRIVLEERSPFQEIQILESPYWGKILFLDKEIQSTTLDDPFSNEMRIHVPFYGAIKTPRKALLIGGGNGASLRELLKHPELDEIHMAESNDDGRIYENPRVRLVVGDGFAHTKKCRESGKGFDLVILDTTNRDLGQGLSKPLFTDDFFDDARALLGQTGVFAIPAGCASPHNPKLRELILKLRGFFTHVGFLAVHVPSFGLADWTVVWASQGSALDRQSPDEIATRFAASPVRAKIYNPEFHWSSLHHNNWHKSFLK